MSDGVNIVAEAILRVEHKLDAVMRFFKIKETQQLHFVGVQCPLCDRNIEYQIDVSQQVVKRVCGCKTGKQPSLIPLTPVPGVVNGPAARSGRDEASVPAPEPEDGDRRKGR